MKIIASIASGLLIVFGVLFIIASTDRVFKPDVFLVGLLMIIVAFGLIWFATRKKPSQADNTVTLKIDLPGDVKWETLKCQSCGGSLSPENVKMVAGAPVVNCPYCKTSYQLTEQPKW